MSGIDSLVGSLLLWIAANSSYDTTQMAHPEVQLMSPAAITQEYYSSAPELIPTNGVDPRVKALYTPYDGQHGVIYLRFSGTIEALEESVEVQEVLLHELVHHVQWQTGVNQHWRCQNEGELEAYALGAEFLRQHSVQDHLLSRRAWAQIYSTC